MARAMTPDQVFAAVERVMARPFAWGPCDCSSAACDVFAALWGFDPMARVRGYQGERGALRLMRESGGMNGLAATLAAEAGLRDGHAAGGLALVGIEGRASLAICIHPGLWAGKSLRGFALVQAAEQGWHLA
ncbi:DUF6950 family protein [Paracoccus cavernae]